MTRAAGGVILALLLAPARSAAQEVVCGWEGGPANGYAFAEPVVSVPRVGTTSAFVVRPTVGFLYYDFRESGGFTKVTSPGVSVGVAYRLRRPRITLTVGPGLEVRWDHRDLAAGGSKDQRTVGATAALEAFIQASPLTTVSVIANYGRTNRYLWSRAGLKRQLTNRDFKRPTAISLGVEGTGQGNHDVTQVQIGGFVEVAFVRRHASLQVRAGYAHLRFPDASTESRPYAGVGFYRAF